MIDLNKMLILAILSLTLFAYIWTIDKVKEVGRSGQIVVLGIFGVVLMLIFMLFLLKKEGIIEMTNTTWIDDMFSYGVAVFFIFFGDRNSIYSFK